MRRPFFFFRARPLRLAVEILFLSIVLWLFLFWLHGYPPFSRMPSVIWMQTSFAFLAGPACMCWSAIRLRRFEGGWWRRILTEMFLIIGLGFVLNVAGQAFTIALFHATIIWSSRYDIALLLTVAPIVDYGVFFCKDWLKTSL